MGFPKTTSLRASARESVKTISVIGCCGCAVPRLRDAENLWLFDKRPA
jgi:hypothetical protein